MTRRGIPSVPLGDPDCPLGPYGDAWLPEGVSGGGLPPGRRAWIAGATPPLPPPPGGRGDSRMSEPHLWQTVAVTEAGGAQERPRLETSHDRTSYAGSRSSKITKLSCLKPCPTCGTLTAV